LSRLFYKAKEKTNRRIRIFAVVRRKEGRDSGARGGKLVYTPFGHKTFLSPIPISLL
jgi:hypothetical protein